MPDIQITPACAPHQQTHAPRSSRTDALSLSLSPNRHESRHGSRRAAETLVRQSGVGSVHRRMSSSYKALLQSLDDDVVRGLGRQIKLKNERYANRRKTCCSRCCASAFTRWLCVLLCLAVGLAASVAIPMVIVLPVDSQWHYRHWFHNWRYFASNGSNFTEVRLEWTSNERRPSLGLLLDRISEGTARDSRRKRKARCRVATGRGRPLSSRRRRVNGAR